MVDSVGAPFNNATANNATANNANTIIKKLPIDEINKKHPASNTMTDNLDNLDHLDYVDHLVWSGLVCRTTFRMGWGVITSVATKQRTTTTRL